MVGVPLCGTPEYGPMAGKMLCTVHLSDGTAVVAGQGMLVRGTWEAEGGRDLNARATDRAKQVLARYEAPTLDPAMDEALLAFIAKRKAELPNNVT